MSVEKNLQERSGDKCELCAAPDNLGAYEVSPTSDGTADQCIYICQSCKGQIEDPATLDIHHWHCLSDSMWTPVSAVQVMAWRMLKRLSAEGWAQDLLDMLYLDDETQAWAEADGSDNSDSNSNTGDIKHMDSNGAQLEAGDTVTLIKDLNVKGAGFTAKRGTAVRNISLVPDNVKHIEGRVNGQQIVILTEFVKKSN